MDISLSGTSEIYLKNKTEYTLGFLFNPDLSKVLLIRKNKPDWQKEKLNGIGGHIEEGEHPDYCMIREFSEEVDYKFDNNWTNFAQMEGKDFVVHVFTAISNLDNLETAQAKTKEEIEVVKIKDILNKNTIENLPWLIFMAKDFLEDGRPYYANIVYE